MQEARFPTDLLGMKIDDLLARWPTAAQVFIAYRLACIGCEFSGFHTMEQALEIYDLQSSRFVEELRRVIERETKEDDGSCGEGTVS